MKFTLEIELGNDAMTTPDDVAYLLGVVAEQLDAVDAFRAGDEGRTRDVNGNTVGRWQVLGDPLRFAPRVSPPVGLDVETERLGAGRVLDWIEDPKGDGRDLWLVDVAGEIAVEWADECHVLPGQVD